MFNIYIYICIMIFTWLQSTNSTSYTHTHAKTDLREGVGMPRRVHQQARACDASSQADHGER